LARINLIEVDEGAMKGTGGILAWKESHSEKL